MCHNDIVLVDDGRLPSELCIIRLDDCVEFVWPLDRQKDSLDRCGTLDRNGEGDQPLAIARDIQQAREAPLHWSLRHVWKLHGIRNGGDLGVRQIAHLGNHSAIRPEHR